MTKQEFLAKPMRIAAIQYGQTPQDTFRVPQLLAQGGFSVEQLLHAVGHEGYGLYDRARHEETLRRYLQECKKNGLQVILYANAHMVEPEQVAKHPEWAQRNADGTPAGSGEAVYACVNSSWREEFFRHIQDSLEQEIQGIFLDGPIFTADGCHCPVCRKLFAEEFGIPMEKASPSALTRFKSRHIGRFVHDVRCILEKNGDQTALYANCLGLTENITGCTVDAIYHDVDLIGTEGGFLFYGDPNEVSLWHGSESAKFMESKCGGKPYVIFCAGNDQPWARGMHTAAETTLLYGAAIASGAYVWYGIHGPIENLDTPAGREALRMNRFLARNEACFSGTHGEADVVLLWSQQTADAFPEEIAQTDFVSAHKQSTQTHAGSFRREFEGFADMLFRSHVQFAIADETSLAARLSSCRLLILPNVCCMDEVTAETVRCYAEGGGAVLATLETACYAPDGARRAAGLLDTLLGIVRTPEIVHAETGCTYLRFCGAPLAAICGGAPVPGFTTGTAQTAFAPDCTTLAREYRLLHGRYGIFPQESTPVMACRHTGRGTALYAAGGLGQTFRDFGIPELRQAVAALCDALAPGRLTLENALPTVEAELRRRAADGSWLIHFVNHTGCMRRPAEAWVPNRNITVHLKTDFTAGRVHTLLYPKELPFTQKDGEVEFITDVTDYELVIIEPAFIAGQKEK